QEAINVSYHDAAFQIERLNELQEQKDQMLHKAELAAALVERVPRSILMAELINRMPPRLGLVEFELKSDKMKAPRPKVAPGSTRRLGGVRRAPTREEAAKAVEKKVDRSKHAEANKRAEISKLKAENKRLRETSAAGGRPAKPAR
ncbi:MAG: hypothetical protein ACE5GT_15110, partial [Rhodospirillales bacterium]